MAEKITLAELETELSGFTGTESYWSGKPLYPKFVFTDGVRFFAERVGAFWLVDLIFSHQLNKHVKNAEFQLWTLKVNTDRSAEATCKEDTDMPFIVRQKIEYTDFPEGEIKLYFIDKVLLLPNEY